MLNNILCSNCKTSITIDIDEFLKGKVYQCSNCDVKVGVDEETDLEQEKILLFKKFAKTQKTNIEVIPCPDCGLQISFQPKDVKKGIAIVCGNCKASVSFLK
jgi:DNA-directed RNA polymerase subunit RPC12/RpoP